MIGKRIISKGLEGGLFGGLSKRALRKVPVGERVINVASREVPNVGKRASRPVIRGALPSASRNLPVHVPGRGWANTPGRNLPVPHSGPNWRYHQGTRTQAQEIKQAARKGKATSRAVIGAVAAAPIIGAFNNRTGPAADRGVGRPTGMYQY
jgi:hypothetical protein